MSFNRFCYTVVAVLSFTLMTQPCLEEDEPIGLQNLNSRTIIYCYSDSFHTAEQCAAHYEDNGYTRLRDIPRKTANYDFLTVDTYPSRRWRNGELTPRW